VIIAEQEISDRSLVSPNVPATERGGGLDELRRFVNVTIRAGL
jgi:hypothetical protein